MSENEFSPRDYGPSVADLLSTDRLMELGPGRPVTEVRDQLSRLTAPTLAEARLGAPQHVDCCLSALWLWFDFLDESHNISQSIPSAEGSYWHGIMHRREPDASNAKYWYRRVGPHPIFDRLSQVAVQLDHPFTQALTSRWDPNRFIDLCEQVRDTGSEQEHACRQLARAEWQFLFHYCWTGEI